MKLSVIEVNFRNDCMSLINDCFGKENKDVIPYPRNSYFSLLLGSKKSILWYFSETPTKR